MVWTTALALLGCWTKHSCTCHSFPTWWLPYFSQCSNTCWNWHFPVLDGTTRCSNHVTQRCLLSCPTLWKLNGSSLPLVASFFCGSLTRTTICFPFSRHYFGYHTSTSLLMCESKGRCLVISSSYQPTFHLSSAHFFTTLCTHLNLPHPTIAHLSWC